MQSLSARSALVMNVARVARSVEARVASVGARAFSTHFVEEGAAEETHRDNPWAPRMLTGLDLIREPKYNKGMSFTLEERKSLKLEGLLPSAVLNQDVQAERVMTNLRKPGMSDLDKYEALMGLSERNEKLFYHCMLKYTAELTPIVYTPTVGQACQKFGHIWRNPRGMYLSIRERGRMHEILDNWPNKNVKAIVFTDGERILGLGDLGTYGMGIPIGKLMLYSCCGGVDPSWCLPVTLDVGTNNPKLLGDPLYTGLHQMRARGEELDSFVGEFIEAAKARFGPYTLLQFEDFGNHNAFRLLNKFRDQCTTFNDDIQGTASVALAGVLAALRLTNKPLKDHRFVFYGAGEAGIGIANLIAYTLSIEDGISMEQARKNIWLVDSTGLIVKGRAKLNHEKQDFAHPFKQIKKLEEVVAEIKPTALIGVCAIPQTFTEKVVKTMAASCERPIIMALSNPTSKAECTAEQCYTWTNGKGIFASGSPFAPVNFNGKTFVPGQGNNVYIFPGVALGVIMSGSRRVTEKMFYIAARTLAKNVSSADLEKGSLYPPLSKIREVSAQISAAVAAEAYDCGLATNFPRPKDLLSYMKKAQFSTKYKSFI